MMYRAADRVEVPALDVFARSARFDLAFKAALAQAWRSGSANEIRRATAAYLEMMRARTDFFESVPPDARVKNSPRSFLESFRRTAESLARVGFLPDAEPIPVDEETGELLNGAHRVATCFAYGLPCHIARFKSYYYRPGGSAFSRENFHHLHRAVENFGVRAYVKMNPYARILIGVPPADAVVWHRRRPVCVVSLRDGDANSLGSREETLTRLDEYYPELPFPDWSVRAKRMWPVCLWWRLQRWRYLLLARIRHGRRREKSLLHARALLRRELGFVRLARALERRGDR